MSEPDEGGSLTVLDDRVYTDDHPPPHVHVKLRDGRECTVDLNNFEIKGRIAEREIREILSWIESNRGFLFDEWQRYSP